MGWGGVGWLVQLGLVAPMMDGSKTSHNRLELSEVAPDDG